ncbi:DUF3617 domain-containing protein [Massilia aurea]|uniref:DUF3617 domain-containing protein n=1 Tax=Massilia aurea TaxID=373040 RepID=UPI0034629314
MKTKRVTQIIFALASVCATQVFAQQPTIKPGLWQIDVTLTGNAADNPVGGYVELMKSGMASMTPEQRAQIEKMLAASGTELKGDGLRTKQCITQADISKFNVFGKKGGDSCTTKTTPIAGGMNVNMVCTQPRMKVDAVMKAENDTSYRFESVATVPGPDGKEIRQKSNGTGKWLGSECGKIGAAAAGR